MTERPALRSQRLNQITHAPHAELDALVAYLQSLGHALK